MKKKHSAIHSQLRETDRQTDRQRQTESRERPRISDRAEWEPSKKVSSSSHFRIYTDRQLRRLEPTMLVESSHESIQFTEAFEKLPPILVPEAIM